MKPFQYRSERSEIASTKTIDELYQLKFKFKDQNKLTSDIELEINDEIQKRINEIRNSFHKIVTAETYISIEAVCPHCSHINTVTDRLQEHLSDNKVSVKNCSVKILCPTCGGSFIVTEVIF